MSAGLGGAHTSKTRAESRTPRWLHAGGEALLAGVGQLLQILPGMLYRRRPDGRWAVELASPGCRSLTGFSPEDLRGGDQIGYRDLVHPDDRTGVEAAVRRAAASGQAFRHAYRIVTVDGRERHVDDIGQVVHGPDGHQVVEGFVVDAPAPAGRETQLRALVEQSLAGIYLIREGRFTYVNGRFAEIFGYSVDEILALSSVLELVRPEDHDLVATNLRRRVDGAATHLRYQFRGLTKAGVTVDVEVHGRRVELDGARHVLGTLLDVSERAHAERAHREAEKLEALRRLSAGVGHDLNNYLSTARTTADVLRLERSEDHGLVADLDEIIAAIDDGVRLGRKLTHFARGGETDRTTSPTTVLEGLAASLRHLLGKRFEFRVHVEADLPLVSMSPPDLEEAVTNLVLNAQDAMPGGGILSLDARADALETDLEGPPMVVLEVADNGVGMSARERMRAFEPHFTTKGARGTGLGLAIVGTLVRDAGGRVQIRSEPEKGTTVRITLPAAAHR